MEESKLSSIVAALQDELPHDFEYAVELAHEPTRLADSSGPNSGPNSPRSDPNSPRYGPDDQQPLLLNEEEREKEEREREKEKEENERGSQRMGDVELRIPVRLQKMKAASEKAKKREQQAFYRPYFTFFICIVDIIVMIVEIIVNKGFEPFKVNPWIGVSGETLLNMGGKYTPNIITEHQWWRLLTPVFLHVGLGHLALNLVAQLLLGIQLERVLGTPRVIIIYFVSAVAGNLASAVFLPLQLEVGASTAIYGLASYYLVDLLIHWSLVFAPLKYLAALIVGSLFGLFIGLLPGIDNFAHLGGSAGGFLVSLLLVPRTREGQSMKYARLALWVGPPLLVAYFACGVVVLCVSALREDVWRCAWCEYLNCIPIAHWCS